MRNTYFIIDELSKKLEAIESGILPSYTMMFGGYQLKKEGLAELLDFNEAIKQKLEGNVVFFSPLQALRLKNSANKTFLININSNHIISRNKGWIKRWGLRKIYNSCDVILCVDKSQVSHLKELGIKSKIIVNPLMIDIEEGIYRAHILRTPMPYFISSGFDSGREFGFISTIHSKIPIVTIGRHCPIPYIKYCELLTNSHGMVLNIQNGQASSDISGNTTVLDALCCKIPVIINEQPWLSNINSKNIYIYKNADELNSLIERNLIWKDENITFDFPQYIKKFKSILGIRK